MKQFVDFFFDELCHRVDNAGVMYEKCFLILAENESSDERFGYLFKLIKFLKCESNSGGDDVWVLCVLTLCELASEMVKTRESFLAECVDFNSLELDLKVALRLPGENIESDDVRWPVFGSTGLHSTNANVIDMCEVRGRIENNSSEFRKNKKLHPLDELSRCSLLCVDVLALYSRLECSSKA